MNTYEYPKSHELFDRATKVIPAGIYGHLGPSEGCFIPIESYPFYADHAQDSYIWDVDGNRFIDYMCAYGPNVLGYNHPKVNEAFIKQLEQGNCTTLPTTRMIELAELLVDEVASADWAFFAKNGGDVTNMAVLTARAATGRDKIIRFFGGYHGVAQWMQYVGYAGITDADLANVIDLPFNDIDALEKAIAKYPNQIAGIISTPYYHPTFVDNELPAPGYWQKVRELCDKHGIVLIIDDVRCGFRLDERGSDYHYGFKADLICFCKALANGFNISALCGSDELKAAAS
ncbi:MAG: aminotransferase class III-fold pyridoxal phosphate-dependent enzyme, partial [Actinomyces sp.]|nr:aminotransferase class III-fold pyridoxal phosphate-dependent enzyme [Actinomyces sp.]